MKKVLWLLGGFASIMLSGTLGFMYLEGMEPVDSLYLTVITLTTVGYGDIVPIHPGGKLFAVTLVLTGAGFVMYMFSKMTELMIEGGLRDILERRRMNKAVQQLSDHFIVCGFGRIGKEICKILRDNHRPFVVVENSHEEILSVQRHGYIDLEGEAADDEVLIKAGIERARGLIAVVSTDADNLYITLTARGINKNLFILARSSGSPGVELKLMRAGASKVISPYTIGAHRMAQLLVRPTVIDFIDLTFNDDDLGLRLEEILVSDQSPLVNKTLMESGLRKKYDIIVVAIKRNDGQMVFNPKPDSRLLAGDILVVLGETGQIKILEKEL
ncbi:MAG: potassium transporter TrkA [Desulfobulbaceae bacterium A2]|nr:MAG: potassium transporter TrkA [Desulfobulbaceae bacterium A2]